VGPRKLLWILAKYPAADSRSRIATEARPLKAETPQHQMTNTKPTTRHCLIPLCAAFLLLGAGSVRGGQPEADGVVDASPLGALLPGTPGLSVPTPSRDGLRLLIQLDPAALGPLSVGAPNAGLLFNPRPMPEGRLWKIRNARETYGTTETIGYVIRAIDTVEEQFPGSPRVVIGDISDSDGGRLNWHASHQVGRDVDIGFYHRREADDFRRGRKSNLDVPRTWALVRALITETDVDRIFVDRSIQRHLFSHAVEIGEDRGWLDDIFGRKTAGKDAIIQHVRRHRDHLHVRFFNPRAQEWGRIAYPLLVKAGLAPGPTVTHRVRSGETLSHLSRRYGTSTRAIRRANGLRGSMIRAGRRYVIPIRRIPSEAEPIVIPPRHLPPAPGFAADESGAGRTPTGASGAGRP
jgi:LysM repeat protein